MKGTGVWISTSVVGGRPNDCFYRNPVIWRDADMEDQCGGVGSRGGYRTDGQTAGSDLVGRNRSEDPNRRN